MASGECVLRHIFLLVINSKLFLLSCAMNFPSSYTTNAAEVLSVYVCVCVKKEGWVEVVK